MTLILTDIAVGSAPGDGTGDTARVAFQAVNSNNEAIESEVNAKIANIVEDTTPQLGGALDGQGNDVTGIGVLTMTEQAAAEADVAGQGQFWVKTATPNQAWFTDDAGTDFQLGVPGGTGDFKADGSVDMTGQFKSDVGTFASDVADGASAVGFLFNTTATFSTAGAKLLSVKNNTVEKFSVDLSGRIVGATPPSGNSLQLNGAAGFVVAYNNYCTSDFFTARFGFDMVSSGNYKVRVETTGVKVASSGAFSFASAGAEQSADTALFRDGAAGKLAQRLTDAAQELRVYGDYASATDYQRLGIKTSRTVTTVPSAASFTLTGAIPAGVLLLGVTTRIDTTCTTATGYTVGDGSDVDLWGVAAAVAAGTATGGAAFTAAGASGTFSTTARDVVVTASGGSFDGTGVITVCVHCIILEAD